MQLVYKGVPSVPTLREREGSRTGQKKRDRDTAKASDSSNSSIAESLELG